MKEVARLIFTAGILLRSLPRRCARAEEIAQAVSKQNTPAAKSSPAAPVASSSSVTQLEKLSEQLKQKNSPAAYAALSAIAMQKSSGGLGILARRWRSATTTIRETATPRRQSGWTRAKGDPLLADYALYWAAETDLAQRSGCGRAGGTHADSRRTIPIR